MQRHISTRWQILLIQTNKRFAPSPSIIYHMGAFWEEEKRKWNSVGTLNPFCPPPSETTIMKF